MNNFFKKPISIALTFLMLPATNFFVFAKDSNNSQQCCKYIADLEPEYKNGSTVRKGFEFKNICAYINWRIKLCYEKSDDCCSNNISHQYLHSIFVNYPKASEIAKIKAVKYTNTEDDLFSFPIIFIITMTNGEQKLVDFGCRSYSKSFSVYNKFTEYNDRQYKPYYRQEGYRFEAGSKEFEIEIEEYDFFEEWFNYPNINTDRVISVRCALLEQVVCALSEHYFDALKTKQFSEKLIKNYYHALEDDHLREEEFYELIIKIQEDENKCTEKYVKIKYNAKLNDEYISDKKAGYIVGRPAENMEHTTTIEVFNKFTKDDKSGEYSCKPDDREFYSKYTL